MGNQSHVLCSLTLLNFILLSVQPALYMYHMHAWSPWRPDKSIQDPETGVTEGCKQLSGPL